MGEYTVTLTGEPFNDAYRYVDWLLTVPLLLIELILVMKLPKDQTVSLGWKLGVASAVMVALGYPGEIQDDLVIRWVFWFFAMIPFTYVVFTLVAGLNDATDKQPDQREVSWWQLDGWPLFHGSLILSYTSSRVVV